MRKFSMLMSVLILAAMILAACGGEETSTSIPTQNVPPVTTEVTETSAATEPSTAGAETATEAPTEATTTGTSGTPGIPVTGGANSDRLSNELHFKVVDQSGDQVGKVEDMVLDLSKAKVLYVIVNANGQRIPVPWTFLKVGPDSTSGNANAQQNVFILQTDPDTFNNAPVIDLKNVPGLGQAPDSWDIAFRKYWEGGGAASSSNTPAPVGTAATDMTATATSSAGTGTGLATATSSAGGTGTGLATATPTSASSAGLATSTPAPSSGTSQGAGTGRGATAIQGVQLASKVLGAKLTVGVEGPILNTPAPSAGGTGTGSATATPTSAGTGSATATPTTSGAGTSLATATPTSASAGAATSAPSADTTAKQLNATIDDLIVSLDSGDILYIVVKTNFDDGEHLIPVPLRLLQLNISSPASDTGQTSDNNQSFVLNIDATTLQNAPFFQKDQLPDMTTPSWNSEFESFWQNNGTGSTSGPGTGVQSTATATPTP